jgi:hypothetical protein
MQALPTRHAPAPHGAQVVAVEAQLAQQLHHVIGAHAGQVQAQGGGQGALGSSGAGGAVAGTAQPPAHLPVRAQLVVVGLRRAAGW